ncbi:hypothetical protein L226DRAFT_560603 [Lentinus tigrinus ALCF2SS1-7]|uniref:uncharacterized protein n=1 Tax=Lentinus tigrinus ALCF2SS1-7 TaxID=1328758 RepID=UPI00116603E6|nr:hypothetical protein L226DRAFT_560603 [Lentinus tigrinus ALCF2SS1-7]
MPGCLCTYRDIGHAPTGPQRPLPSILQIPPTTFQEPSSIPIACSDSFQPEFRPWSTLSTSSGGVNSPAPQDRTRELELESVTHCQRLSAALPDNHTGEAPYVMKLPRSGITTSRISVAPRLEIEDVCTISSPLALLQAGPESGRDDVAALDIGAPIRGQRPVALSPKEPGLISSQSPAHCETSTAMHAGSAHCDAPDVPTVAQTFNAQGPASPDMAASRDLADDATHAENVVNTLDGPSCSPQHSPSQDFTPSVMDNAVPADLPVEQDCPLRSTRSSNPVVRDEHVTLPDTADVIRFDGRVLQTSLSKDFASFAKDEDAASPPVDEGHPANCAIDSAVILSTPLELVPSDDISLLCPEMHLQQLVRETVKCHSSEILMTVDVAASVSDMEPRPSLSCSELPTYTTRPALDEKMAEETSDDTAKLVSPAMDLVVAPVIPAEADEVRDVDPSDDHLDSQTAIMNVLHSTPQGAVPVQVNYVPAADCTISCSTRPDPFDVSMDCDKPVLEVQHSDDTHFVPLPPVTIVSDSAVPPSPHSAASGPTDTEDASLPLVENTEEGLELPFSAGLVTEDSSPLQSSGEDITRADDVLVLSTRIEDTAVDIPVIVWDDPLRPGNGTPSASTASELANTVTTDAFTDASVPIPVDDVDSVPFVEQLETPQDCAPLDDVVGISLASDVPPQAVLISACMLSEQTDVPYSDPTAQITRDSPSMDVPVDVPIAGAHFSSEPTNTVCSPMPMDSLALTSSSQDGPDAQTTLDVDLAEYYTAVDFTNATSGSDDFDAGLVMSEDFAEDLALPEYALPPSSPPPSSSPPRVFSSPGPASFETTPTSSPPLPFSNDPVESSSDNKVEETSTMGSRLLKRSLETDIGAATGSSLSSQYADQESKRVKTEDPALVHTPPNPRRPTPASQAKQRKKLAAPFRSPIIKGPLVQGGLHAVYATGRAAIPSPPRKARTEEGDQATSSAVLLKPKVPVANKDRTANVAKQFKSPLQTGTASSSGSGSTYAAGTFSSVKAAPTIQTLQGKVQTLKQAIRIKKSGGGEDEDDILEGLVEKWTTAAREIAWALWDYVKDLDTGSAPDTGTKSGWFADDDEQAGPGLKRGIDPNWGYDDGHVEKRARVDESVERGDGDVNEEEEEEAQVVQHTPGVMLRRLGIDPATLGWDEEEGDFVDVDA